MLVTGTDAAAEVVDRARAARRGELTITIGTGCCESTAPFLYEDFWPGPDQEVVGEVGGVPVYAPEYLRSNYPDGEGMTVDVIEGPAESMSIETEFGFRLVLRGTSPGETGAPPAVPGAGVECDLPGRAPATPRPATTGSTGSTPSTVALGVGELPAHLRGFRIR